MAGGIVRVALLAEFRFATATLRAWEGLSKLKTLDDHQWDGVGQMADVSGLSQSVNATAPALTLSMSGVDADFAAKAKAESDEYYNRAVVPYLQFFDEDWACLDNPYPITLGRMTNITARKESSAGGPTYTVTLTAESPFATRRRPRFGFWTDRDQQQRFPGDRGLERVAGIDNKTITFPDF